MARALQKIITNKIPKLVRLSATQVQLPLGLAPTALTVTTSVSGIGGLDTGAIAASSLYYVYLVNGVSLIASLSATSPTGFTIYRKVGAFFTDSGSSIFRAFYFNEINIISLGAGVTSTNGIYGQNIGWIASSAGTAPKTVTFTTGFFSVAPIIVATIGNTTGPGMSTATQTTSTTNTVIEMLDYNGNAQIDEFTIVAIKAEIDAVQPDWSL